MNYLKTVLIVSSTVLIAASSIAQQRVKIEGVWELLSQKVDGKESPITGRDVKTITKDHWVWIYQDKAKMLALLDKKTVSDSLAAYAELGAGAGTYTLAGNTYTETIEFFPYPIYIGLSIDFTVKVEGDRFYQSGKMPIFEAGKKVRDALLEEVYKRIE
jgi:hypothetical protein